MNNINTFSSEWFKDAEVKAADKAKDDYIEENDAVLEEIFASEYTGLDDDYGDARDAWFADSTLTELKKAYDNQF